MNTLVSIVIPTRNSVTYLYNCLESIKKQTHKNIEIIVVDGKSTDGTLALAQKFHCKIYTYVPKVGSGSFDATYKRNYGAKRAKGAYIYWMDTDMELPPPLIKEAIDLTKKGADAVILPEDSFGKGIWARAKNLERRCYWGDDTVECPRFFKKSVWDTIGGLDESLGAGGDDLDIHQKVIENNFNVSRTKAIVMHNEGALKLSRLFKKHFMYGRDTVRYFIKRPKASLVSYFPIRPAYLRHLDRFIERPIDACAFVIMRTTEYFAGFLGFLYSFIDTYNARYSLKATKNKSITMDIEEYAQKLPQYYSESIPPLLQEYLDKSSWKSLLDCGCGDGSILTALNIHKYFSGKKIFAIDLSKNRIQLVKKIDPHIHAHVDDALKLSTIKKNSIDFLYSSYVIEHVDNKKMFQAIERVTTENATIYISTLCKKWYGWYYKRKNGKWVMDVTHKHEYERDSELFDTIDQNQFQIVESKKSQMFFPITDFIIRRLPIINRNIFIEHPILNALRKITIPIVGYYDWEIILKKRKKSKRISKNPLVSIIIPTKNSSALLKACLVSLRAQQYKNIEILLVDDGKSEDLSILKQYTKTYKCKLFIYNPKVKKGLFDATKKRNYAAKKSKGDYIYHFDADMESTKIVIKEAVKLGIVGADAVIVKEDSFGIGPWASAKNLERRFFWGDDAVESPRFFKTSVWNELGGYDENIAGGGDDRDIYQKMLHLGYNVKRTTNYIRHNEGKLTLLYLMKKQFMYKREVLKFIYKRPEVALISFFPIRKSYFTQWRMLTSRPKDTGMLILMKTAETVAGLYGIAYSLFK